jgi:hypothetical protein
MAQTKKKRRRKHRGTQGGKIDTRPRGKPRNRAEAKQRAAARRAGGGSGKRKAADRPAPGMTPPTWGAAITKALFAGVLFFVLLALVFKNPVGGAAGIAALMTAFYVPMAYYLDRTLYNYRRRKEEREKLEKAQRSADESSAD